MKKALEMQLLRLSEEAMHQRQSPSSQASYIGEIRGLRIDGSPSARSSEGLAEPGTPDQQEAGQSPRAFFGSRLSLEKLGSFADDYGRKYLFLYFRLVVYCRV